MQLSAEILKQIMPTMKPRLIVEVVPILNQTMFDYGINNQKRIAAFLATLAQESGEFKYQEELASGAAYDTRTDLGNTAVRDGDGQLYKGRGRIQVTGKFNYKRYSKYLAIQKHLPVIDFVREPEKLKHEPYATDAAGWFFAVHIKANPIADRGDFLRTQILVNGRTRTGLPNHWRERKNYYDRAIRAIPADFQLTKIFDGGILAEVNIEA